MKKNESFTGIYLKRCYSSKIGKVMRISFFLFLIGTLNLIASNSYSQKTRMSFDIKQATVKDVLKLIENESEFYFLYNNKLIDVDRKVDLNIKNEKIKDILLKIFNGTDVQFLVMDRQIVLTPKNIISNRDAKNSLFQQNLRTVNGTVTDNAGEPIPGVSVVIKGTSHGTITDVNGKYSLSVPTDAILVFSFIGMKTIEIAVNEKTIIDITMKEDITYLEEVVSVGYSTQKKINLTGAVTSVNSETLVKRTSTDISNTLSGLVPGLTVIQNSGQPGADAGTMYVRGIGTLRSSDNDVKHATTPLVLVDGIESSYTNIDPNDIENIVVLRDASSAAIYGVRAANGVILITTKRGSKGDKAHVNYNMYIGWQNPTRLPDFLESPEYAEMYNTAHINDGLPVQYTQEEIEKFRNGEDSDNYPNTDWLGAFFSENGFQQNHNLSISGGSEKMQYAISLNYIDRNGNINNTGYDRYTLRTNIDNEISDNLKVGMNFSISNENIQNPALGLSITNVMREPPTVPIKYSNGDWGAYLNEENSVAQVTDGGLRTTDIDKFMITLFSELKITKDLMLKGVASFQKFNTKDKNFKHYFEIYNANHVLAHAFRSSLSNYHSQNEDINLQAYFNYTKKIGEHRFTGLLGYEQNQKDYGFFSASIKDLPKNNNLSELDAGDPDTESNSGYSTEYRIRSGFSRINYSYKDKYLFEVNLRYDGTSRFPSDNRFAFFPSFSFGWRVLKEQFLNNADALNNLKLRASWGKLGNQEIGNYPYQNVYTLGNIYSFGSNLVSGIKPSTTLANEKISWETTTMLNFGIDVGLFRNLNFSADYFIKETYDILLNMPQPDILGAIPPIINAGEVRNKGFELTLQYYSNRSRQFTYNINANYSFLSNKIIDLKGADVPGRSVGDPVYNIFGYEAEGLFQSQQEIDNHAIQPRGADLGDIKYKDQITVDTNGDGIADATDGIINGDDRVSLGSYFPKMNFGLQFSAGYKSFDFSLTLQGAAKVKGYPALRQIQPFYNKGKVKQEQLDYWRTDNRDAEWPRLSILYTQRNWDETTPNSWWVKNASYLKIRNLQIGYTLKKDKLLNLDKIRIYIGADNLLTITNFYKDLDPEIPIGGGLGYPMVRTLTAGLNIVF